MSAIDRAERYCDNLAHLYCYGEDFGSTLTATALWTLCMLAAGLAFLFAKAFSSPQPPNTPKKPTNLRIDTERTEKQNNAKQEVTELKREQKEDWSPRSSPSPSEPSSPLRPRARCVAGMTREEVEADFNHRYPEIARTEHISEMRATEFSRLDKAGHTYLDYTGGGLYAKSQLREHMELLEENTFGNPHSSNPTSQAMTKLVEQTRDDILKFFNTDSTEYDCIFTANASAALRIVGESYPFMPGGHYLLPSDNHNSVNGIREFARAKGATVTYLRTVFPALRMDPDVVTEMLEKLHGDGEEPKLFAYPAQSNFSGVQHSLDFIEQAHLAGWDVILDAAAYAPTNRIDLQRIKPDFMPLSFYKLFGYPTGMGALIVKRSALAKLTSRPWFAGGTIEVAFVSAEKHWLHRDHEGFEDGTVNYLGIPALSIGLRFIERCGIDNIHNRVLSFTGYLMEQFLMMKHKNGKQLFQIYGPQTKYSRGGTIAFNIFDPEGTPISCYDVETLANQQMISLRAGCFCNPGNSEDAFQWSEQELHEKIEVVQPMTKQNFIAASPERVTGAVRVSVGVPTNYADLYKCLMFFQSFLNKTTVEVSKEVAIIDK